MRTRLIMAAVLIVSMVCAGLVFAGQGKQAGKKAGKAKQQILYVCNCGNDCKCNTVALKPGKCTCGTKLAAMHVLKIEKDEAVLCTCGKGCTCKIDETDATKCGCGKDVKRVSLKGFYVCNCGDGCDCNTISDKPGKCRCGNELRKVE